MQLMAKHRFLAEMDRARLGQLEVELGSRGGHPLWIRPPHPSSGRCRRVAGPRQGKLLGRGQVPDEGELRKHHPEGSVEDGRRPSQVPDPQGPRELHVQDPSRHGDGRLRDNAWHVVRCARTPTSVTRYVDGVRTGRSNNATGLLNNTKPWTIGGKGECDAVSVTCDYFAGEIDYVRMTKG